MCAYNQVNGEFCSEHSQLLTDVLKEAWKHEGFVMTDWGAINERVKGLKAGLELEMPYAGPDHDQLIVDAVRSGELDEAVLDQAVERLLTVIFHAYDNKKPGFTYDKEAHHVLARRAAAECMVLLKNDGGLLPLDKKQSVAVIGAFAAQPRYQGGGSSHIVPTRMDTALEFMKETAEGRSPSLPAIGSRRTRSMKLSSRKRQSWPRAWISPLSLPVCRMPSNRRTGPDPSRHAGVALRFNRARSGRAAEYGCRPVQRIAGGDAMAAQGEGGARGLLGRASGRQRGGGRALRRCQSEREAGGNVPCLAGANAILS